MIKFNNLSCIFPSKEGLVDINTEVNKGDTIVLIGPSGSGKSTLFRCINLLLRPTGGEIIIDGKNILDPDTDIYELRKRIGMVFQEKTLFSHLTLLENVMMGPMDLLGLSEAEAFERAKKHLAMVGLGEKLDSYPDELSEGQHQRGEIARCLAMNPEILLLDEPTASLDSSMIGQVKAVINRLSAQGLTMMIITHDFEFCKDIANRIIFMDGGRIVEEGTPDEIFEHPVNEKTKAFVHNLRSFRYIIKSEDFDLYELNSKLESFGRDYFLSKTSIRNLELVVEELIFQNILKHTTNIEIEIRYYESTESLGIKITYEGEEFDPFNNDDEDILSMLMVRQFTSNVEYSFEDRNRLQFNLKTNSNN